MMNWVELLPALVVSTVMMKDEVSPTGAAAVVNRQVVSLVMPAKALPVASVIVLVGSRVDVVT